MALTRLAYEMVASTQPVVANKTVGSIVPGQNITTGTTLQEFIELMVTATFEPSYVAPTALLDSNISSPQEVGYTSSLTLTETLIRGRINGVMTDGVWDEAAKQGDRSGAATTYTIHGQNNGGSDTLVVGATTILAGNNTFNASVAYAIGDQPVDSKGDNFEDPLPIGSVSSSKTIVGYRKYFYGVDHASATSADIRTLANGVLNPTEGTTFDIVIPKDSVSVVFAYPGGLRDVNSVKYVEFANSEVKGAFTKTAGVQVVGADSYAWNSYSADGYKVYRFVPNAPFQNAATYRVTI